MKNLILIALTLTSLTYAQNEPDASVNLALSLDANVSGSVSEGRGKPTDILFNPKTGNYENETRWAEYGVKSQENLGKQKPFWWKVEWEEEKLINYITFGGTYDNQPQPNTTWIISYKKEKDWEVIDYGVGGWIDSGIYEWKPENMQPIKTKGIKVELYSNGKEDLVSIHLRGRGGKSQSEDDTSTETKATLIQLLPYEKEPVKVKESFQTIIDYKNLSNELLINKLIELEYLLKAQDKKIEILENRMSNLHSGEK